MSQDFDWDDDELALRARDAKIRGLEDALREVQAQLDTTRRDLAAARRRETSLPNEVAAAVTDAVADLLEDHRQEVRELLAQASQPSADPGEDEDEPYERRAPKRAKMDADEKYRLLCQLAARARCARKNLSPRARRRVIEQARELNALPDDDPLLE